ncbi:Hypothetical protein ORPV_896 [Orpheovirus IHUMI-LCC2]|uniref:F-box domain-containing protein n=1 Tax=Orpheovirus IHUMI-LCC2 TaxID=2023057 RepID=A0A2I2L5M6_9VIRU|nr:Hypothetical protein ORPV_896 [Orpheovirus IHUMI-LCC2]SNW62800.1 Hypothetical protein ORPV_896 [Orpheovirus IHUMI-LCC2]
MRIMENNSIEIIYHYLIPLSYKDILNFCITNISYSSIYKDEYFWRCKFNYHYPEKNGIVPLNLSAKDFLIMKDNNNIKLIKLYKSVIKYNIYDHVVNTTQPGTLEWFLRENWITKQKNNGSLVLENIGSIWITKNTTIKDIMHHIMLIDKSNTYKSNYEYLSHHILELISSDGITTIATINYYLAIYHKLSQYWHDIDSIVIKEKKITDIDGDDINIWYQYYNFSNFSNNKYNNL